MIRPVCITDRDLITFLYGDTIVNYFILLGLELELKKYKDIFEGAWIDSNEKGRITAALFKRKTGNMQFYGNGNYDIEGFISILDAEGYVKLIGEKEILRPFRERMAFSKVDEGAFISRLRGGIRNLPSLEDFNVKRVMASEVDRIVELYKTSFSSFAPPEMIRNKLLDGSGRGYYFEDRGKIICTAQTAFENSDSAVIVGVATHPEYRNKGYAGRCVSKLCEELIFEGKRLALQYDNQRAGSIYRSLGFEETGRMINCYPEIG